MPTLPNVPVLDLTSLEAFLHSRHLAYSQKLSEMAHPNQLKDAEKAAKRIAQAIQSKQKIALVGDYDVDGVTATALVKRFFNAIDYPLTTTIPNRFTDGYGISPSVLQRIEADLILTVDNGINAFEAAQLCKDKGIDLIITDHHTPSETLPNAFAIVNPKQSDCPYPQKEICGAQVGWLLMALVKQELALNVDMRDFFPYLTLAIIADVMPLLGINRTIVRQGLEAIKISTIPAFQIMREFCEHDGLNSEDIAYQIAPRINSAGRLEDASIALNFLLATSVEEAQHYFDLLTELNTLRKATEAQHTEEAMEKVDPNDTIIVVAGEGWNEGVVGIVASRLVSTFGKPSIVLSIHDGIAKGSGRSIGNVDLHSLIKSQENLLVGFGGHKMAAGLSMKADKIALFKEGINKALTCSPDDFIPTTDVIGQLDPAAWNEHLLQILERYEPYGEANPRPHFLLKEADIVDLEYMGKEQAHTRLQIRHPNSRHTATKMVAFRKKIVLEDEKKLSCSYTVRKNAWRGKVSVQLSLERLF